MHEYSLKATARNPRLNEYAICKIRKEVEVENDKETHGPVDNNIPDYTQLSVVQVENHQLLNGDYNHLPIVQVEDHQLLNGNMFASQVAKESVPYQNYGSAYSDMLLQAAEGGGTDNMNPEPSLVFDVNCSQDYNQFGNENIFLTPPVDIVSHQDYGEWNVYAHMLSQPAEGSTSSNGVCDWPQPDNMQGSMNLMSTVNSLLNKNQNQQESDGLLLPDTSTDLVNVAAATPNQLQQGNNDFPQCQSLESWCEGNTRHPD